MSEGNNQEYYDKQFGQLAFNKLYKICYKNITGQRGLKQFVQADENDILKCHQKLLQAFQIILPSVVPAGEGGEAAEE